MNKKCGSYAHPRLIQVGSTPIDLKFKLSKGATNFQVEKCLDFCREVLYIPDARIWKGYIYIQNVNPQYIQFFIDLFNASDLTIQK